ncbi:putative ribonuclease H-like domain-containing protein [Tanacetum coccineum]|uniref:Ribonuclease H-like domain-containing protein n=1 Tax=Tanacetum coccineum TaxID=301880 RepID=A0ABQ4Y9L6_9ASTR
MKKMYCLVVTDDFSRFSWVFFLATKDETSGILKAFITGIENQINHRIKIIRCDNGTEFKNKEMNQFFKMKGIKREFSVARTPQQNRVAKRKNRTLIEAVRTMLADSKIPTTFWAEAVNTACYVQNRVLVIKPHNKTPYELFHGRTPSLSFMRPFGCPVTILNTLDHLGKFDGKADEGFFVGYSVNSKAFRVFNSRTRIVEATLHITFLENKPNVVGSGPEWLFDIDTLSKSMNYKPVIAGNQTNGDAGTKESIYASQAGKKIVPDQEYILLPLWTSNPLLSKGPKNTKDYASKKVTKDSENKESEVLSTNEPRVNQEKDANVNSTNNINTVSSTVNTASINDNAVDENIVYGCEDDPNIPNFKEIVYSDDEDVGAKANMTNLDTHILVSPIPTTRIHKDHPVEQIIGDIHSAPQTKRMIKRVTNHVEPKKKVWTFVDLPNGKRAIVTKWVYMNKKDKRGIVVRNKVRLVAQGYTQEEGIDYDEVFAPVARIEVIRLFLANALFMNFIVYQMDMKSAFLYGKIEKEVYVCQPSGFEDPEFLDRVYKVEKALYGLHQAPKAWIASTPMETSKPLLKDAEAKDVDVHLYRSMIGSLMYLTAFRPAIIFVVCACARFQVTPKVSHLHAMKRIFRYLKDQPKLGLWYLKDSPFDLEAYSDSDYTSASLDRKSTIGGCQFLRSRLISWQCKKQTIVSNSTTEAEYVAVANCYGQVLWIQNQMLDYGYNFMNTKIFIDNESTICIVKNPVFHSKTKYIDIRHHFIRDSYEKILIQVIKIHTDHNVADLLTKALDIDNWNSAARQKVNAAGTTVFNDEYDTPSHTKKVFANMRRKGKDFSGTVTPLFATMLIQSQVVEGEGSGQPTKTQLTLTTASLSHVEPILIVASSSQPKKTQKHRKTKRNANEISQSSGPTTLVADKTVHEERGDSVERAATTATSLDVEQGSSIINRTQSTTRSERVSIPSYDSPLLGVNTPESDQERIKLKELMDMCTKLSDRVLDLENIKDTQALEIRKIESSAEKSLDDQEDASQQGRNEIDQDEGISWFQEDSETQGDEDLTIAQTLMKIRSVKSKEKSKEKGVSSETTTRLTRGVIMKEASETATRSTVPPLQIDPKDKGKGIMQEPEKLVKGKDQIEYDADVA